MLTSTERREHATVTHLQRKDTNGPLLQTSAAARRLLTAAAATTKPAFLQLWAPELAGRLLSRSCSL